jgi:hypothetical protein
LTPLPVVYPPTQEQDSEVLHLDWDIPLQAVSAAAEPANAKPTARVSEESERKLRILKVICDSSIFSMW